MIGWLSEVTNLRVALGMAACLGLMIAYTAKKVVS